MDQQRPITDGHRDGQTESELEDFDLRQRLNQLSRRQYWQWLLVFAVGFTGFTYVWQNYWLPDKPIQWRPWSRFMVQQALSLQRPILVHVRGRNTPEDSAVSLLLRQLDNPSFRKEFHLRSGVAFELDAEVEEDQLLWQFQNRPESDSLWFCPPGGSPQPLTSTAIENPKWLSSRGGNPGEHPDG